MVSPTMLVTAMVTASEQSTRAISISASAVATAPASDPPWAEGTFTARRPRAPSSRISSSGKRAFRSASAAAGAALSVANFRAVATTDRWVSVPSKSTP